MPVIRAVCFDIAGVLTRPIGPAFVAQTVAAGLDVLDLQNSALVALSMPGDSDLPANRLERGEISLAEFFDTVHPGDRATRVLFDPVSPHFVPAFFEPSEPMHAFVDDLVADGYRLGVISNGVHEWVPWWEAMIPLRDRFDVVVHSCQVGLRKPNPAIYYHALVQLGVEPHEALFLDDFDAMVDGARSIGMHVVHVTDHDAAIAEARFLLNERG